MKRELALARVIYGGVFWMWLNKQGELRRVPYNEQVVRFAAEGLTGDVQIVVAVRADNSCAFAMQKRRACISSHPQKIAKRTVGQRRDL